MLQSAHPSPPFNKRACSVVITAALLTAPMAASVYPLAAWAQGSAAQYDFNIAGGNLENPSLTMPASPGQTCRSNPPPRWPSARWG